MARTYTLGAREDSARRTREAILDAAIGLAYELERVDFPLEQIAARAERSVQTLLRHFGSRDALIEAAVQRGMAEVVEERRPPAGDIPGALDVLIAHYERRGRFVLRLLAMEDEAGAEDVTSPGRLLHRAWVEQVFGDAIEAAAADGLELTDLLVVATDVSAWRLLRLDRGLPVDVIRQRMATMTDSVIVRLTRKGST
jgi:AcrR family transcriptional regulator